MGTLRSCSNCDQRRRSEKAILPNSRPAGIDMLAWLKGIALYPCNSKASQESFRKLCNQSLHLRKFLFSRNGECPPRKRKFERFGEGTKLTAASTLTPTKSDSQNITKLGNTRFGNTRFSSLSRSLNSGDTTDTYNQQIVLNSQNSGSTLTFEDTSQEKHVNIDIISLDDGRKRSSISHDLSTLNDIDGCVNAPHPPSLEELAMQDTPLVNFNDLVQSSYSSSSEERPYLKFRQVVGIIDSVQKPLAAADFIDSAVRLISGGDHLPRPVIPVGSKFQAEVPEWRGPEKRKNIYDCDNESENLKWLGTQVWPMESKITEITVKAVGKGRRNSCSCVFPESVDCIKRHVLKRRLILQSEVGPAFLSWKFDEMGEAVSKSWTLEEQCKFESLVEMNPLSGGTKFWELALKHFPSKSKKSILSYYYNVYIPRRMSLQTRSSLNEFYSDDDQADDDKLVEE